MAFDIGSLSKIFSGDSSPILDKIIGLAFGTPEALKPIKKDGILIGSDNRGAESDSSGSLEVRILEPTPQFQRVHLQLRTSSKNIVLDDLDEITSLVTLLERVAKDFKSPYAAAEEEFKNYNGGARIADLWKMFRGN